MLQQLGCGSKDRIHIFNKIDLLGIDRAHENLIGELHEKFPGSIFVSAQHRINLDRLILKIAKEAEAKHAILKV